MSENTQEVALETQVGPETRVAPALSKDERVATKEEKSLFLTPDRSSAVDGGKKAALNLAQSFGNHQLDNWTSDQLVLTIQPDSPTNWMSYDPESENIILTLNDLENAGKKMSPRELERNSAHELTHKAGTNEYRQTLNGVAEQLHISSETKPLEIIDEAVVSEAAHSELEKIDSSFHANHDPVYTQAWLAFVTLCEKVADKLPEFGGNESTVMQKFQEWMLKPGAASEMVPTLQRALGDSGLRTLLELTSGYEDGVTNRLLSAPSNSEKYARLREFLNSV